MNNTVAVIVTYNRKELLKQCIDRVLSQREAGCDIIIIDNASSDGTKEMVCEEFSPLKVRYYNTEENLGGAGGFEYGVKKGVELGYEYLWLMDDDTIPEPTALKKLFEADKELKGEWGFLSSVAYWTDGSICKMNVQKKDIFSHIRGNDYNKLLVRVKMASFVSLLIKSSVVNNVGFPIGEYFIWTDDYEYTGRIAQYYPSFVVSESKVVHAMRENSKPRLATAKDDRIDRYYYLFRNDVCCYRKYGLAGWCYIVGKMIYNSIDVVVFSSGNIMERILIIKRGFGDGLRFLNKDVEP